MLTSRHILRGSTAATLALNASLGHAGAPAEVGGAASGGDSAGGEDSINLWVITQNDELIHFLMLFFVVHLIF